MDWRDTCQGMQQCGFRHLLVDMSVHEEKYPDRDQGRGGRGRGGGGAYGPGGYCLCAACGERVPHQPGIYPEFLAARGVQVVITGRMGQRAADLFRENGIEFYMGTASSGKPRQLVEEYIKGTLKAGSTVCDHHSRQAGQTPLFQEPM